LELVEQVAIASEQGIAPQQHVEAVFEQFARCCATEQEQVRRRAPDQSRTQCTEPRHRLALDPNAVDGDQPGREQAHAIEPLDFACRDRADTLRDMHANARRSGRKGEFRCHAERIFAGDTRDTHWEVAVEIRFPAVVMDDRGDAGEQVLPRAGKQRLAAREGVAFGYQRAVAKLDVARPGIGVWIRRFAEPAVMVTMEMVVGVDQAGTDMTLGEVEPDIEIARSRDERSAFDRHVAIGRADQDPHRSSFTNDSASTTGSPRSASYCAIRPARS